MNGSRTYQRRRRATEDYSQPVALRLMATEIAALDRLAEIETMPRSTLMRRVLVAWLREHGALPQPGEQR